MEIKVTSTAFEDGGMIPSKYTADGANVSPPLSWSPIPEGAKSVALICDDPDAPGGDWVHWVVFNLPSDSAGLLESVPPDRVLANGGKHGTSDFRKLGYLGPSPPSGTHRYFFKVYALDTELDLEPGATKADVEKAMAGHILAQGRLIGKYSRR